METGRSRSGSGQETVIRARHSPVMIHPVCSDWAGLMPSQDAQSAGPGQGQSCGSTRPSQTQLPQGCGGAVKLKGSSQRKGGAGHHF